MKIISLSIFAAVALTQTPDTNTNTAIAKTFPVKDVIKVYQTPDNNGSITVQSVNRLALNFYLFNLEGKLIYQTTIIKNETQTIEGLTKGTYSYHAFEADKNLDQGKIILK